MAFQTNERFLKHYNCLLPWMNDKTLDACPIIETKYLQNETIFESLQTKVQKWDDIQHEIKKKKKCPSGSKCNRPMYNIKTEFTQSTVADFADDYKAIVDIQLESPTVQNVVDSYAYDSQSLIGEVGGTLGLFLGLSTYSLVEFITYFMEKFINGQ